MSTHQPKVTSVFYIPVYFGDGCIDLVGRLAEDSMNDAVEEVKASPYTIGAVRCVIFFFACGSEAFCWYPLVLT